MYAFDLEKIVRRRSWNDVDDAVSCDERIFDLVVFGAAFTQCDEHFYGRHVNTSTMSKFKDSEDAGFRFHRSRFLVLKIEIDDLLGFALCHLHPFRVGIGLKKLAIRGDLRVTV